MCMMFLFCGGTDAAVSFEHVQAGNFVYRRLLRTQYIAPAARNRAATPIPALAASLTEGKNTLAAIKLRVKAKSGGRIVNANSPMSFFFETEQLCMVFGALHF
ncbi:hypothetical protein ACYULU_10720 [Breznakiellaceae bacterium SP9]